MVPSLSPTWSWYRDDGGGRQRRREAFWVGTALRVLSATVADGDVAESAAFSPVPPAVLAEVTWLREIVVVVVAEFGVSWFTSRTFQVLVFWELGVDLLVCWWVLHFLHSLIPKFWSFGGLVNWVFFFPFKFWSFDDLLSWVFQDLGDLKWVFLIEAAKRTKQRS